jgi:hypothetical protein
VRLGDGGARTHDCRVSGTINLLDAGVDESTVLKIGGLETRAMLDRFNVLDPDRVGNGAKPTKALACRLASGFGTRDRRVKCPSRTQRIEIFS